MEIKEVVQVRINRFKRFSGGVSPTKTQLLESIDAELSPENLYCDGEISQAEANRKRKSLKAEEDYIQDNL